MKSKGRIHKRIMKQKVKSGKIPHLINNSIPIDEKIKKELENEFT